MKKYKVLNCPAYNSKGEHYDCWANPLSWCENVEDCLIKSMINEFKELYKDPEYFDNIKDKEVYLVETAWHNAAHIAMSKVEIEEIEE